MSTIKRNYVDSLGKVVIKDILYEVVADAIEDCLHVYFGDMKKYAEERLKKEREKESNENR